MLVMTALILENQQDISAKNWKVKTSWLARDLSPSLLTKFYHVCQNSFWVLKIRSGLIPYSKHTQFTLILILGYRYWSPVKYRQRHVEWFCWSLTLHAFSALQLVRKYTPKCTRSRVSRVNIAKWANDFIFRLREIIFLNFCFARCRAFLILIIRKSVRF